MSQKKNGNLILFALMIFVPACMMFTSSGQPNTTVAFALLLLSRFSRVRLCATPQMAAHQAPPSLGFSRQEHWSGLPFPLPGDLPDPRTKPASLTSPALAGGIFISYSKFLLAIYFTHSNVCFHVTFSIHLTLSSPLSMSISLFSMSLSPLLPCIQILQNHFSRFRVFALE